MSRSLAPIELIQLAAEYLGDIREEVAFVGGSIVGLLVTDPGAQSPRPTDDVDVIIELGSSRLRFDQLEEQLRNNCKFRNAPWGPICRFLREEIVLDVMPTDGSVIGFTNTWYSAALKAAERKRLKNGIEINVITAPWFIATKLEAFESPTREFGGDFIASRDFEDIVAVINGRASIVSEFATIQKEMRSFVQDRLSSYKNDPRFIEGIAAHLDPNSTGDKRAMVVLDRVIQIINGSGR